MGKHGEGHLYKKRGRGCWRVRWTFEGKTHDETTGTTNLEQARRIAREKTACTCALGDVRMLSARLERAKDEQTYLEAKTNPSLNLFDMVKAFMSCDVVRRRKNSNATIDGWVSNGNLLIDEFGGAMEMRQLTREQAEAFMRKYEAKVSPSRFNCALQFFKRAWETLKRYDSPMGLPARLPNESPWEYIMPMKRGEVVGKKPFTKEQLEKIWRVLDEINDSDLTLLFDLARNTGARLHDLVSWKWGENMKFNIIPNGEGTKIEAVLEWRPIKTKNSSAKLMIIPILDERVVRELYKRYEGRGEGEEYILPKMLELYNKNKACALTNMCQSVFVRAGLETKVKVDGNSRANCVYGIHSFRHTLVSELFEKGVDLGTIQHLYTGHGSSFMTELYAHANMDKKRIDLSNLAHIGEGVAQPTTWVDELSDEDKRAYDAISLMENASREVKAHLKGLIGMKSKMDLEQIRDWLDKRISQLSHTQKVA